VLRERRTVGRVSAEGAPHCGRVSAFSGSSRRLSECKVCTPSGSGMVGLDGQWDVQSLGGSYQVTIAMSAGLGNLEGAYREGRALYGSYDGCSLPLTTLPRPQ